MAVGIIAVTGGKIDSCSAATIIEWSQNGTLITPPNNIPNSISAGDVLTINFSSLPYIEPNTYSKQAGFGFQFDSLYKDVLAVLRIEMFNADDSSAIFSNDFQFEPADWAYNTPWGIGAGVLSGTGANSYKIPWQSNSGSLKLSMLQGDLLFKAIDLGVRTESSYYGISVITPLAVPEPSTYALFGIGAIGMLMVLRRKKESGQAF